MPSRVELDGLQVEVYQRGLVIDSQPYDFREGARASISKGIGD